MLGVGVGVNLVVANYWWPLVTILLKYDNLTMRTLLEVYKLASNK